MLTARDNTGASRSIQGISVRDSGSVLRPIKVASVRDGGGALRAVFTSGAVSVSPKNAIGFVNSNRPVRITTTYVSLTISGGTAPYTIAWSLADPTWDATNPTNASTAFRSPSLSGGGESDTVAIATVTDANGTVFQSDPVSVTATNSGGE